jgi:hypothetical protein
VSIERQLFNSRNGVTGGVWRSGDVIVKELHRDAPEASPAWRPSNDERHWNYWRREARAYETDLPGRLGLLGRELISSEEIADGVIELRMPAFAGRTASDLELTDLEDTATVLGLAQGAEEQPDDPWLSRGFLRDYSTSRETDHAVYDDEEVWHHPSVAAVAGQELRSGLARMHTERDRLLAIMAALPRTVCHLDLFPNNIFATRAGIGLIDWSFSGDGALGEDVGNLVPDSVFDLQLPLADLEALAERLPAAYLDGLRRAGWSGDDRLVMLGIHASAVKYDWLGPRTLQSALSETPHVGAVLEARFAGLALCARWAAEALEEAERLRIL